MKADDIQAGKQIQRRTGQTFHLATRLLPERMRDATYVLYGFFRVADDVVDDSNPGPPEEQVKRLESIRRQALGEESADHPVVSAFADLRETVGIPAREVHAFVDAMRSDVTTSRYESYADLEVYMRGSSVAVANMMTAVMDPEHPAQAEPHAAALAEAFQLTNFLRDVREDVVEYDRVYLPQKTLSAHGVTDNQVRDLAFSPGFRDAIAAELHRTERRYRKGVAGIRHLPRDCQFPVLAAAVLYADHHRLIRKRDYDVLSATPELSTPRKLWLVARTRWHWFQCADPETVFRRVSVIAAQDRPHCGPEGHPTAAE